jgi:TonB family protein
VVGSLDKKVVHEVIRRNEGQIRRCQESHLARAPGLTGQVEVKFVVSAAGAVVSSQVARATTGNRDLETCVAGRVRTWKFPPPVGGGVVFVTFPFVFGD